MKRLFAAFLVVAATAAHAAPPESFSSVLQPVMPAVVNISTTQKVKSNAMFPPFDMGQMNNDPALQELFKQFNQRFGGGPGGDEMAREVTSLGSGFMIDAAGHVVTNNHVIDQASEITVILSDNTRLPARVIGHDPQTDLALLKVDSKKPLPFVKFGSSDALKVGDWVIAVGNPFGLGGSVSAGIVSARGRNINAGPFDDFIQTDAAINRGNSGGPLFNASGEVVGINSAIFSPTGGSVGIGFAVPSDMARPIIDQLRLHGRTHRGWLGVKIQEVNAEVADSLGLKSASGALVLEISPKSPAAGGLQPGDVITRFDGRAVTEMRQLPRMVAETKVGKKVELGIWRKGRELVLPITLGELETDAKAGGRMEREAPAPQSPVADTVLGMKLVPITPPLRQQFGLPGDVTGLLVTDIDRAGEAAKNGIMPGDIIREVNQQPVTNAKAFKEGLAAASKAGKKFALLRVSRKGGALFVTIPVK